MATPGVDIGQQFPPAQTFPTLGDLINVIVKNIYVLAGVLLFILLIFGGLQFIVNAGKADQEKVSKSKNAITAAIIGFALIFAAYWIVEIIGYITGIEIFKPGF